MTTAGDVAKNYGAAMAEAFRLAGQILQEFPERVAEAMTPRCPRCGRAMHRVPAPTEPGDDSWVWGHDCPVTPGGR